MQTLFPVTPITPPGFNYFPNFISEADEMRLADEIAKTTLNTFQFQGYEAKRKVASFGYDWHFDTGKLTKGKNIPSPFLQLVELVAEHLSLQPQDFAELLLTEYPVGSVINWHRDAPPFDIIAGISLLSDCNFKLRPYDKSLQNRRSIITVPVERCSLYIIQGEARTAWEHSIAAVKQLRYSITLRTLLPGNSARSF